MSAVNESLARHMAWLYGEGGVYGGDGTPCLCDHGWLSLGTLYGVRMGNGWVRTSTHPDCVHHGDNWLDVRRGRRSRPYLLDSPPTEEEADADS